MGWWYTSGYFYYGYGLLYLFIEFRWITHLCCLNTGLTYGHKRQWPLSFFRWFWDAQIVLYYSICNCFIQLLLYCLLTSIFCIFSASHNSLVSTLEGNGRSRYGLGGLYVQHTGCMSYWTKIRRGTEIFLWSYVLIIETQIQSVLAHRVFQNVYSGRNLPAGPTYSNLSHSEGTKCFFQAKVGK